MYEDAQYEEITELTKLTWRCLKKRGVCRVSIMVCRRATYPMYFTLREIDGSRKEERAIRHVEPALAFQLELSHFSNYNLTPIFIENKQLHIYHSVTREDQSDNRFFIRALVRSCLDAQVPYLGNRPSRHIHFRFTGGRMSNTAALTVTTFIDFIYNLPVTLCVIENVSGFIVNFHGYQEIQTDKGTVTLKSIGEKGLSHLQPVHQSYATA